MHCVYWHKYVIIICRMWLTLYFPNLCRYPYTYVRTWGGGPARLEQSVNKTGTNPVRIKNFLLYYISSCWIYWIIHLPDK